MKQFFEKHAFSATLLVLVGLLIGNVFFVHITTAKVEYTVVDANGDASSETWEKSGQIITYFDNKRKFIGHTKFGSLEGLYYENRLLFGDTESDQISTEFLFEKSPSEMKEKEQVSGSVKIAATGVSYISTLESSLEKYIRPSDGRIIAITVFGQSGGPINIVTRLYDDVISNYYLPDEILDQLIIDNEIVRSVHFVANGRSFIPLTDKNPKKWM